MHLALRHALALAGILATGRAHAQEPMQPLPADPDRAPGEVLAGKYLVVKIDGEMSVGPNAVRFKGEDPGFLWRKKATEYIEGKLKAYLDPKVTISDLPRAS